MLFFGSGNVLWVLSQRRNKVVIGQVGGRENRQVTKKERKKWNMRYWQKKKHGTQQKIRRKPQIFTYEIVSALLFPVLASQLQKGGEHLYL